MASQKGHAEKLAGSSGARPFAYHAWCFVPPFVPAYAPKNHFEEHWSGKPAIDYAHEREWRVSHDFTFEYSQVTFVIVDTYNDMAKFPKELKDAIGRDRFLIMDVYRKVEDFWPIHILD